MSRDEQTGDDPAPAADAPARGATRRRRLVVAGLVTPLVLFVGLYVAARIHLRHIPYEIPSALRAPQVPADALAKGGLLLRYLGTAGIEVSDGKTTVWVDPVPTRPTVTDLITGPLKPDRAAQRAMKLDRADAILVNHAHFDHVLDVPDLALQTGAKVIGTQSTLNLCRSRGVPAERLILAEGSEPIRVGTFTITTHASRHGPIGPLEDPWEGAIPPDAGELWFWQYTQDGTRSYRLEANGASVYVSAGSPLPPGKEFLNGGRIGPTGTVTVGLAGPVPQPNLEAFLKEVRPRRLVANHFDNFFHPLSDGLAMIPPGTRPEDFAAQVAEVDPAAKVYVLDYGQQLYLPPDAKR